MSENRAERSGLAKEAKEKTDSKYNQQEAAEVMEWLKEYTGEELDTSGDPHKVHEVLKDGYVLCRMMNVIKENSIPNVKRQTFAARQRDLLDMFTTKAKALGVPDYSTFAVVDLHEEQNMVQVITCLRAVARRCQSIPECPVQGFGPKEAAPNKRDFTDEQLAQGKNVIGLQMGSNKGANQSGQNFGKGRMIVD